MALQRSLRAAAPAATSRSAAALMSQMHRSFRSTGRPPKRNGAGEAFVGEVVLYGSKVARLYDGPTGLRVALADGDAELGSWPVERSATAMQAVLAKLKGIQKQLVAAYGPAVAPAPTQPTDTWPTWQKIPGSYPTIYTTSGRGHVFRVVAFHAVDQTTGAKVRLLVDGQVSGTYPTLRAAKDAVYTMVEGRIPHTTTRERAAPRVAAGPSFAQRFGAGTPDDIRIPDPPKPDATTQTAIAPIGAILAADDMSGVVLKTQGGKWSEYQRAVFRYVAHGARNLVIRAGAGAGKCLGLNTPVMLFDGRVVASQELKVGDLVMGPDRESREVLSTTVGHGPLWRITPAGGDSWVCNDVHVLTLVNRWSGLVIDIPLDALLAREARHGLSVDRNWQLIRAGSTHERVGFDATPIGDGDYYGFTLSGDGQFCLGDFTVTHNTSTIMQSLIEIDPAMQVLMVAFNKTIRKELATRVPAWMTNVTVTTLAAHGYDVLKEYWRSARMLTAKEKNGDVCDKARDLHVFYVGLGTDANALKWKGMGQGREGWKDYAELDELLENVSKLMTLCECYLAMTPDAIRAVQVDYDLILGEGDKPETWTWKGARVFGNDDVVRWVLTAQTERLKEPPANSNYARETVQNNDWKKKSKIHLGLKYGLGVYDALTDNGRKPFISFRDMTFVPAATASMMPRKLYDRIFVDETQDMDVAQAAVVLRSLAPGGRIVVVGDENQCHPAGVMVRTPSGDAPIETVKNGDEIQAWSRHSQKMLGQRHATVSHRLFTGTIYTMRAAERSVPMTGGHKLLARWASRDTDVCVTYLMWREGFGFRVGWCKFFCDVGNYHQMHLGVRARIEKADKAWVLKFHDRCTDASVYESIVAARYGIPTITFEPVDGAQHITAESIARVFDAVRDRNHERGLAALSEHGREFEHQFYPYPANSDGTSSVGRRATVFSVYAVNVIPQMMRVPLPDDVNEWATVESLERSEYSGDVYSLDVSRDHTYAANGVVVQNSIYRFRGADSTGMHRLARELNAVTLPLMESYRVPVCAANEAATLVPDFSVPPGTPEGQCGPIDAVGQMPFMWRAGDIVISRVNAPLVPMAMLAITKGITPLIMGEGSSIAHEMRKIFSDIVNLGGVTYADPVERFHPALVKWSEATQGKLIAEITRKFDENEANYAREWRDFQAGRSKRKPSRWWDYTGRRANEPFNRALALERLIERSTEIARNNLIFSAFWNPSNIGLSQRPEITTVGDVEQVVRQLAPSEDDVENMDPEQYRALLASRLVLTSVHRIKGGEANRVFLLKETFRWAFERWQKRAPKNLKDQQEEKNLWYVAVTRVRAERGNPDSGFLFYVTGLEALLGKSKEWEIDK